MLSRTGYVTQLLSQKSSGLALKTMLVFLSLTFWHILMASSLVNFFLFSVKRCLELVCSGTVTGPRILARIRELVLWMLICGFIWQTQLAWYQTQLVYIKFGNSILNFAWPNRKYWISVLIESFICLLHKKISMQNKDKI